MKRLLAALGILALSACSSLVPVPEAAPVSTQEAEKAWASVLSAHVDDLGRVNFQGVAQNLGPLKSYVRYIATHGPKTTPKEFPTPQAVLAHYINAYNALSMYNIIDAEIPQTLSGLLRKAKFFYFKKFVIDGEEISLYAYENDIIRKVGEERIHFALNCMSAGCPRLPRKPFTAAGLDSELQKEATRFFNEERNVQVDEESKTVLLSEILKFFTEDFLAKAPNLIQYANRYRRDGAKLPEGYDVDFIDYDWTVNRQPGKGPQDGE